MRTKVLQWIGVVLLIAAFVGSPALRPAEPGLQECPSATQPVCGG